MVFGIVLAVAVFVGFMYFIVVESKIRGAVFKDGALLGSLATFSILMALLLFCLKLKLFGENL